MSLENKETREKYTLLDFLKTFGIRSTTNFDLLEMAEYLGREAKQSGLEIEVIMKDELKDIAAHRNAHNKAHNANAHAHAHNNSLSKVITKLIINYQNENQKGTHWVAAAFFNEENLCYYFDSFGLKPLDEIYEMFPKVIYNKEVVQHYETEICGQLCIYFLYRIGQPVGMLEDQRNQKKDKNARFKEIISELKELYLNLLEANEEISLDLLEAKSDEYE